jgi:hypothetical protein
MKMNAIAARKRAAFRMPSYTRCAISSQLCTLALTLTLFAIPLTGIETAPVRILTPLPTELVPLGQSLQALPGAPVHMPAFATAARYLLECASQCALGTDEHGRASLNNENVALGQLGVIDAPSSRAPPSA